MEDQPSLVRPITFESGDINSQSRCPLFTKLPGELRDYIFSLALSEFEVLDDAYDHSTCYKRPELHAPRRTDTALLRSCRAIYCETWFLPWTNAEHSFYLTTPDRRPPKVVTVEDTQCILNTIHTLRGDMETSHMRVYAQLWSLEPGYSLSRILGMSHFYPRVVTITIRHTDWWFWEEDNNLRIGSAWVSRCEFPASVRVLCLVFESLVRKQEQINNISAQAAKEWAFKRKAYKDQPEAMLVATEGQAPIISRWTGSSTWHKKRWIRDESRPEELDYYAVTVTYRPRSDESARSKYPSLQVPPIPCLTVADPYVESADLSRAGVIGGTSAEVVRRMLHEVRLAEQIQDENDVSSNNDTDIEIS